MKGVSSRRLIFFTNNSVKFVFRGCAALLPSFRGRDINLAPD
jgi:hypothetical protein